eukprot:565536-Pelagomonas_calceolata.AAC.1
MLDCCSARHVEEWAGLRTPTSELCTGAGAFVQRHSRGNTMCGRPFFFVLAKPRFQYYEGNLPL